MLPSFTFIATSLTLLGFTLQCNARALSLRDDTPFDGQYIHASATNGSTEWWWVQATGTLNGQTVGVHLTYYQGYPLESLFNKTQAVTPPSVPVPSDYVVVDLAIPNQKPRSFTLPAVSSSVTYGGGWIIGDWIGVGEFQVAPDLSFIRATINVPSTISAEIYITRRGQPHYGCTGRESGDPYFGSALPAGAAATLSETEKRFFNQLGWATSIPGGAANVNLAPIGQAAVTFQGQGYHDANWMPVEADKFVDQWYFLNAQVGPYNLAAVTARIKGSTRVFNQGFLEDSGSGTPLQLQCSLEGMKTTDVAKITPWGAQVSGDSGLTVMQGFVVEYTLKSGDVYRFNLTGESLVLDQSVYHRWVGTVVGGKVGDKQYTGFTMFDWLNPGNNAYSSSV